MNTITNFLLVFILLFMDGYSGYENPQYLGQKPPGLKPEVFAPGLISKSDEYEFGSVFNSAVTEFYYGVDLNGKSEIRYAKRIRNKWSKPKTILVNDHYGYNDPFLSPDEKRLYFISQRADDGLGRHQDYDIWYVERQKDGWSEPINAGPMINSTRNEYYISFNQKGTMYFASNKYKSNFDIYKSAYKSGAFLEAERLGPAINTQNYEADVFIDPEEDYIIFCAERPDGLGRGDLYISFKNPDASWTKSKNMGQVINTSGHELCPFVSKDGKYLFYTSNQDIYWVDARIIEGLRKDK